MTSSSFRIIVFTVGDLSPGPVSSLKCLLALLSALVSSSNSPTAVFFFVFAAILGIACLVRLILRVDVITVYGRRSKAQITFQYRKGRAREVYNSICEKVRQSQEALAAKIAAETPPEPPVVPVPRPPPLELGSIPPLAADQPLQ